MNARLRVSPNICQFQSTRIIVCVVNPIDHDSFERLFVNELVVSMLCKILMITHSPIIPDVIPKCVSLVVQNPFKRSKIPIVKNICR